MQTRTGVEYSSLYILISNNYFY